MEKIRSMVIEDRIPNFIWVEVINTRNYLVNHGPIHPNQ